MEANTNDLKIIKKKYGEKMAHYCRDNFATLLEIPGLLSKLILDNFHESRCLYEDIEKQGIQEKFKNYIYSMTEVEESAREISDKTPEELMAKAGYILQECYTEEEIQAYKRYYEPGEELCTFKGQRLNRCRVFFAVKKDVDEIRREDFKNPQREDEYGTSVISIQFSKDKSQILSIKNRYNHRVENPDATFSNNLENIISGLTSSFEKYKGIIQAYVNSFEVPGYVRANDGKYYKYNYEFNNVYYCPDNIIIDNFEVKKLDESKYLLIDRFIVDLTSENRGIRLYDSKLKDSFTEIFPCVEQIQVTKDENGKVIHIWDRENQVINITIDKFSNIIGLYLGNVQSLNNNFLEQSSRLKEFIAPELIAIGDRGLFKNTELEILEAPKLREVGEWFLTINTKLKYLNTPNLQVKKHGALKGWFTKNEKGEELTEIESLIFKIDTLIENQEYELLNDTRIELDDLSNQVNEDTIRRMR